MGFCREQSAVRLSSRRSKIAYGLTEHHLRPKPSFVCRLGLPRKRRGESTCSIPLNAPTASRLVAVSIIVSSAFPRGWARSDRPGVSARSMESAIRATRNEAGHPISAFPCTPTPYMPRFALGRRLSEMQLFP